MFTSGDSAYLLAGLPILLYGYVICLDSYSAFGKDRHLPKWAEPFFMILFGVLILFGGIAKRSECHHGDTNCTDMGLSLLVFSVFMMLLGTVGLMSHALPLFATTSVSWTTPLVFAIAAVFMWIQGDVSMPTFFSSSSDDGGMGGMDGMGGMGGGDGGGHHSHKRMEGMSISHYDTIMARGFAVAAFIVATLRALTMTDPVRWGVFTAYATSICGLALSARSKTIMSAFNVNQVMPQTVLLGICTISTFMLLPLLGYIFCVTRNHVPQVHAPHHRLKNDLSD